MLHRQRRRRLRSGQTTPSTPATAAAKGGRLGRGQGVVAALGRGGRQRRGTASPSARHRVGRRGVGRGRRQFIIVGARRERRGRRVVRGRVHQRVHLVDSDSTATAARRTAGADCRMARAQTRGLMWLRASSSASSWGGATATARAEHALHLLEHRRVHRQSLVHLAFYLSSFLLLSFSLVQPLVQNLSFSCLGGNQQGVVFAFVPA